MIYVTFAAVKSLLLTRSPDWIAGPPKVRMTTPHDVVASTYAVESRRVFARSVRYQISYTLKTRNAAESTALRQAMNVWKSQPVICPLWSDHVQLALDMAAGSNFVPVAAEPGLPARSGKDWIALNEATGQYEFFQVANFNNAALNLLAPGLQNNWPAGTKCYPLIFGLFTERPQDRAITGELLSADISVGENSDFSRAIYANANAPAAVGAAVPDFSSAPLWNIRPDWVEPGNTTEADVDDAGVIGFGRQTNRLDYPQFPRRRDTLDFKSRDRGMIARAEAFWADRRARTKVFAAPTWRNDLKLAQDAASGATSIAIAPTALTNPDFAAHPGAAFLALINERTGAVEPIRATNIGLGTVTLIAPLQAAHSVAATAISHLLLARFADDSLEWEYTTPLVATTTLTVVEMTGEYAAPQAELPEPVFLYRFTQTMPNGYVSQWLYTSYESNVVIGADTWTAGPFSHQDITSSLALDQEQATVNSWLFAGNPLGMFMPYTLESPLQLEILEADARTLGTVAPRTLFAGEVLNTEPDGKKVKATVQAFGHTFDFKWPRGLLQGQCNWIQYTPPCGLDPADWLVNATVAVKGDNTPQLQVNLNGAYEEGRFAGGWLQGGGNGGFFLRDIFDSTASTGASQLTVGLDRPLNGLAAGTAIQMLPCCGYTRAGCKRFNNDDNYSGWEFAPATSPSIQAVPASGGGGGK